MTSLHRHAAIWAAVLCAWTAGPAFAADGWDDLFSDLRAWSSLYAGRSSLEGKPSSGTQSVSASIVGTTWGADSQIGAHYLAGGSVGLSHQTFSSTGGNGGSDDVMLTLYGREDITSQLYLAEAVGYGWHSVTTRRAVTITGLDVVEGRFHSHDIGGRLEGGYVFHFAHKGMLSPFVALVGDSYAEPAYDEFAPRGAPCMPCPFRPPISAFRTAKRVFACMTM